MAVPTSGSLSMLDMAQEALYATYGTGSVTGPISMYDMMNGGNTKGSGNSYPSINTACTPNPASGITNSNVENNILEWDVTSSNFTDVAPVYYSGAGGVNTILYTTPCGTETLPAGTYVTDVDTFGCTSGQCATELTVNSSGKITAVACDLCF